MLFVLLPAYNEEGSIADLLERLDFNLNKSGIPYRIVIVDDGSRDRTLEILERYSGKDNVAILRHDRNLGLGAAIRTGMINILKEAADEDIVVTMDADDTQSPMAIQEMVRRIRDEGLDIVVGSRFRKGSVVKGVPLIRRLLSLGASLLFRLLRKVPGVRDYTSGYRAYRVKALKMAIDRFGDQMFHEKGFSCTVDILFRCTSCGARAGEVPMELRYDRKRGGSKMKVVRTILRTLKILLSKGR